MGFPMRTIQRSSLLAGERNGDITASKMTAYAGLSGGPTVTLLSPTARKFRAMRASALTHAITLNAAGPYDSFRPLWMQQRIFYDRYSSTQNFGCGSKYCGGRTWYKRCGEAVAACPGTSNHGWAGAIDVANSYGARLDWMVANAVDFGFCWEIQSEPWHLVDYTGDTIPDRVLAWERSRKERQEDDEMWLLMKRNSGRGKPVLFVPGAGARSVADGRDFQKLQDLGVKTESFTDAFVDLWVAEADD